MLNPDLVGRTMVGATSLQISEESIALFASSLGGVDYVGTDAAPPTFGITITLSESQALLQGSGLDWTRVVHGDQRFEIFQPLYVGMNISCNCTIESARVVAGNEIVTVRSDLISEEQIVVSSWSTLVFRG
jgi:hypothetical protein